MRLALLLPLALAVVPVAAAKEIRVGPDQSLQAAVDAASSGDTLRLRGTHAGQVVIEGKSLRLVGEPGARIVPDGAPLRTFLVSISEIDFGPFDFPFGGLVTAVDCDVTLEDLAVDGEDTLLDGVVFIRAGGGLRRCEVKNLCLPTFPELAWDAPGGTCVTEANDGDVLRTLDVLDCRFTRWNYNGVVALGGPNREPGPTRTLLRVEDCVVEGAGESPDVWQFLLYSSTGTVPEYRRNTARDAVYTGGDGHPGTGIWCFFPFTDDVHPCVVERNAITNVQQGIILWGLGSRTTVADNTVRLAAEAVNGWALAGIDVGSWAGEARVLGNDVAIASPFAFSFAVNASSDTDVAVLGNRLRAQGDGAATPNGIFCGAGGSVAVRANDVFVAGTLDEGDSAKGIGVFGGLAQVLENDVRMVATRPGAARDAAPRAIEVSRCDGARIAGNELSGAGASAGTSGLVVLGDRGDDILGNDLADFSTGILLDSATGTKLLGNRFTRVGQPIVQLRGALVTEFLVPALPLDIAPGLGENSIPAALPEDYITIGGSVPTVDNVREGAAFGPGSTGRITTAVRSGPSPSTLYRFRLDDPARVPGDPALFEGDRFYIPRVDTLDDDPCGFGAGLEVAFCSSTMFFFLDNKTGHSLTAWLGFASDDSGTLFVNGERLGEFIGGRDYGPPNAIQGGTNPALLLPGRNLVQLSYTEGCGDSGGRVGVFADAERQTLFDAADLEPTVEAE